MTDNNYDRTLKLPDTDLPFFAYGIFKPGQLAYSKIKNHVKTAENVEIHYEMKSRDGVPILIDDERDYFLTKGYLITFNEGHEEDTYSIISNTLLNKLYEWKTIKINEKDVNVVFGVNPDYGSNNIEYPDERVNYDGKNDLLFSKALKLIENNLKERKNSHEINSFFELQMNYMLLWSAIDRFSSLKYNRPLKKWNNEKFANERLFKEGIKKFKDKPHRPVYSTEDLTMHEFNEKDSYATLKYYYTFRCNVVHRGKSTVSDYSMLKTATEELLEIFKDILENSFKEP